jgi:hypothetical protein
MSRGKIGAGHRPATDSAQLASFVRGSRPPETQTRLRNIAPAGESSTRRAHAISADLAETDYIVR